MPKRLHFRFREPLTNDEQIGIAVVRDDVKNRHRVDIAESRVADFDPREYIADAVCHLRLRERRICARQIFSYLEDHFGFRNAQMMFSERDARAGSKDIPWSKATDDRISNSGLDARKSNFETGCRTSLGRNIQLNAVGMIEISGCMCGRQPLTAQTSPAALNEVLGSCLSTPGTPHRAQAAVIATGPQISGLRAQLVG